MKNLSLFFILFIVSKMTFAQKVYQIRADSVRIYNVCDTAELILENRTQHVDGFLFNKGAGRTEFRKLKLQSIGASRLAIVGQDTLDLSTLPGIAGGIDSIYAFYDSIRYLKQGVMYTFPSPEPFKVVPNGGQLPYYSYRDWAITPFTAYTTNDMPYISDQAQTNQGTLGQYYVGHVVRAGESGYQMAVNWDGEDLGPKGAFLRIKDDTKGTWGQWRELLFKDYADTKYSTGSDIVGGSGLTLSGNNLHLGGMINRNTDLIVSDTNYFNIKSNLSAINFSPALGTYSITTNSTGNFFPRGLDIGFISSMYNGSSLSHISTSISTGPSAVTINANDSVSDRRLAMDLSPVSEAFTIRSTGLNNTQQVYANILSASQREFSVGNKMFGFNLTDSTLYLKKVIYTGNTVDTMGVSALYVDQAPLGSNIVKSRTVAPAFGSENYIQSAPEHLQNALIRVSRGIENKGKVVTKIQHTGDNNYSVTDTDHRIICDAATATRILTLPAIYPVAGRELIIKVVNPGASFWKTSEPFIGENGVTDMLTGSQTLIFDVYYSKWVSFEK
ncbi:hypothetical protein [Chitinophaga sp. sic0106]|uniref:hypothetical protein n=1 Tax=Chitinophaga sp. sic0106 TaxID=2854785 RepID=UPI001C451F66|nr:hypothetical protein [Chitinophaga sp. sic0106]MBV7531758.1 hypothetical protein [Chitinophaga sp. sic0106]